MKLKRIYKKFYTRDIPLFLIELWYNGEFRGLRRFTDGKSHFKPLFIYRAGRAVRVYYDMNNSSTDDRPIVDYFLHHPERFKRLETEYFAASRQLAAFTRTGKINFVNLYELYLWMWPMLTLIMVLGGRYDKKEKTSVSASAYRLRKKTGEIFYEADRMIIKSAIEHHPSSSKNLNFLSFAEINKKTMPAKVEIQRRKKGFIYFEGKVLTDFSILAFEKTANIKIIDEPERQSKTKFVKGTVAMPGKVTGRIKVVFNANQLGKVKIGDILVAPMTTPDYISAMNKAAAFITDEGGITCHAAIISREMKKPCIIGTHVATKVLHDGDLVEVDAYKGIVKFLKK